jgi:hypothetical protein
MENQQPAQGMPDTKQYQETQEPAWQEEQGKWAQTGPRTWAKDVTCPRCTDTFTLTYALIFKVNVNIAPPRELIDVRCTCATIHPEGKKGDGCGWYGRIWFSP